MATATSVPKSPPMRATFTFVQRASREKLTVTGIVWQTDDGGFHFQLDQHVPAWCMSTAKAEISITVSAG